MRKDYRIKKYISPTKPFRDYRKTTKLKQYYRFFSDNSVLDSTILNAVDGRPGQANSNNLNYVKDSPFQNTDFCASVQIDPTSYYRIPYNPDIENNGKKLTIATWVSLPDYGKLTGSGPDQTKQVIFSKIISGGSSWSTQGEMNLVYNYTNRALDFSFRGATTGTPYILNALTMPLGNLSKEIRPNDWIHIAVVIGWDTYNRVSPGNDLPLYDLIQIYVNGELVAGRAPFVGYIGTYSGGDDGTGLAITPDWRTANNSGDILIARGLNDVSGLIDTRMRIFDFAYWNDALSANEIYSLYSIGEYFQGSGFINLNPRASIKQEVNTDALYFASKNTPKLKQLNKKNTTPFACEFPFNDTRSIDFKTNTIQNLQYPLGLPSAGINTNLRVSSSLATPNSLPDIQAPGYTNFSILEKTYLPSQVNEGEAENTPFNDALVAPNSEDSFYAKTDLIQGFESAARNKLQIVLELPINSDANITRHSAHWDDSPTTNNLDGSTNNINPHYDASGEFFAQDLTGFLYYNFEKGTWEQKGLNDPVLGNAKSSIEVAQQLTAQKLSFDETKTDLRLRTTGSIKFVSGTSNILRMFYPGGSYYGQSLTPGQYDVETNAPWNVSELVEIDKQLAANIGSPMCSFYAPNAIQYFATSSQTIKMSDYIQEPFLLEKIVLEIPNTLVRKVYDNSTYTSTPTGFRPQDDYVFFLMRQDNNFPGLDPQDVNNEDIQKKLIEASSSMRYLICSGAATFYNGARIKYDGTTYHTGSWEPQNSPSFSHDFGETINSSTQMNQMSYTGSINLKMEPAVTGQKNYGSLFVPAWNGGQQFYITQSSVYTDTVISQSLAIPAFWPGGTSTLPLIGSTLSNITGSRNFSFNTDLNLAFDYNVTTRRYAAQRGFSPSLYNERTFFEFNPFQESLNTNFSAKIIDPRTFRPFGGESSESKLAGLDTNDQWIMNFADNGSNFNARSPYMLFPEDELVLGIDAALGLTATMAAGITSEGVGLDGSTPVDTRRIVGASSLTGSLMKINAGTPMYLRLYGSLVKDQIEAPKHPEPLGSQDEISETIIGDKVLDQFDISLIMENSGSYRERFFTGSMTLGRGAARKPNFGINKLSSATNPGAFVYSDSVSRGTQTNNWYPNDIGMGATQSTVITCSIPSSITGLRYPDGWNNQYPGAEINTVYLRFLSGTRESDSPGDPLIYMSEHMDSNPEGKIFPAPDEIWCRSSINQNAQYWIDPYKSENWVSIASLLQAFQGVPGFTTAKDGGTSDYYVNFGSAFLASSSAGGVPGLNPRISSGWPYISLEVTADSGTDGNQVFFLQSSCSAEPTQVDGHSPFGTTVPNNNYSRQGSTGSMASTPTIGVINDSTSSLGIIVSITNTDPCTIETSDNHKLINSQSITINGITDPAWTSLNSESFFIKEDSPSTFEIYTDSSLDPTTAFDASSFVSAFPATPGNTAYYNSNGLWYRPLIGGTQIGIITNSTSSLRGGLIQKNPVRALAATATRKNLGEFASFNRFLNLTCDEEYYYDSAVPGIFDIWTAQGLTPKKVNLFDAPVSTLASSSIVGTGLVNEVLVCGISAGKATFTSQSLGVGSGIDNLSKAFSPDWWAAYPFEPRYSRARTSSSSTTESKKIKRRLGGKAVLSNDTTPAAALYWINNETFAGWGAPWVGEKSGSLGVDFSYLSPASSMGTPTSTYGNTQIGLAFTMENQTYGAVPEIGEITLTSLKVFYGIGDGLGNLINSKNENNIYPVSPSYNGTGGLVDSNGIYPKEYQAFRRMKKPRGWKYGLINALPQKTSAVFRSDCYGQFRDMLEGRKYSVFINSKEKPGQEYSSPPVEVKFQIPVWNAERLNFRNPGIIDTTQPIETTSGNLSPFATSSLPFFDETGPYGKYPFGRSRPIDIFYTDYSFKFEEVIYEEK